MEGKSTDFREVTHRGERKIIDYCVPVYQFPGGFAAPGQYTFPFSFYLPSDLPASIFFAGFSKSHAIIKYSISAVLQPSFGVGIVKMKHKQRLMIRQPSYGTANRVQTDTRDVYACCCFGNKGPATITTQFEKDTYMPNELCRAMVDLDNSNCQADVKSISIKLERHIELSASDGKVWEDKRVLEQKDYDGLGAGQSTGGLNRFLELSLANLKNQVYDIENKVLSSDDRFMAEQMQPTSSGVLVKLYYTLTVFSNHVSTCAGSLPHCTIPLLITPPPLPSFGIV